MAQKNRRSTTIVAAAPSNARPSSAQFSPAGDAQYQSLTSRRFQVPEGAGGRIYIRRPYEVANGLGWSDITDTLPDGSGGGSGWVDNGPDAPRTWVTPVVDLPSRDSFDLQVGLKEWHGATVAQIQRLGIPDTVTIDPSVPSGPATDALFYSLSGGAVPSAVQVGVPVTGGMNRFQVVLDNLPPYSRVAMLDAGGQHDVTEPGHWQGTSWVIDARDLPSPLSLVLNYPDGTARTVSGLTPSGWPLSVTVDAAPVSVTAPVVHHAAPKAKVNPSPQSNPFVIGGTGSAVGNVSDRAFAVRFPGTTSATGVIHFLHFPAGGQAIIDGAVVPGTMATSAGQPSYDVPVFPSTHAVSVVAPNGERRESAVGLDSSTTEATLDYNNMTISRPAGTDHTADTQPTRIILHELTNDPTLRAFLLTAGEKQASTMLDQVSGAGRWVTRNRTPGALEFHNIDGVSRDVMPSVGGNYQVWVVQGHTDDAVAPNDGWRGDRVLARMAIAAATGGTTHITYNRGEGAPELDAVGGGAGGASGGGNGGLGNLGSGSFGNVAARTGTGATGTTGAIALNDAPGGFRPELSSATPMVQTGDRNRGTEWEPSPVGRVGFVPTSTNGRSIADHLAPGKWLVEVIARDGITGSLVPLGSGASNYAPPDIRQQYVDVVADHTAELSIPSMPAAPQTGLATAGGNEGRLDTTGGTGIVPRGGGNLRVIAPANFSVMVDGNLVAPSSLATNLTVDGIYTPGAQSRFDTFETNVAPGQHQVRVADPSAAACFSSTVNVNVVAGTPAVLDYTAPINSALFACAVRNGGTVDTTSSPEQPQGSWWSRRTSGEKVGIVGAFLVMLGAGGYYAVEKWMPASKGE